MAIEENFKIGDAVWYKCEQGEENQPVVLAAVPIKVRWTDYDEHRTIVVKGQEKQVRTRVYVGAVEHSNFEINDIQINDYLWEGEFGEHPDDPQNGDCMLILRKKRVKNLKQTKTFYKFEG